MLLATRMFSFCSPENKFLDGGLAGLVFGAFWLPGVFTGLVIVVPPLPYPVYWNQDFSEIFLPKY
jgi:hypothetical protein